MPQQFPSPTASAPSPGDRTLLFVWRWLDLILQRTKTMEIRGPSCKPGPAWLACGDKEYALVTFGQAKRVNNINQFRAHLDAHQMDVWELPYTTTWLWPMESPCLPTPIQRHHRPGPTGTWQPLQLHVAPGLGGSSNQDPQDALRLIQVLFH